jgi:hypothetical protein
VKSLAFTLLLVGVVASCGRDTAFPSKSGSSAEKSSEFPPPVTSPENQSSSPENGLVERYAAQKAIHMKAHELDRAAHSGEKAPNFLPIQPDSALLVEAKELTIRRTASNQLTVEALASGRYAPHPPGLRPPRAWDKLCIALWHVMAQRTKMGHSRLLSDG